MTFHPGEAQYYDDERWNEDGTRKATDGDCTGHGFYCPCDDCCGWYVEPAGEVAP